MPIGKDVQVIDLVSSSPPTTKTPHARADHASARPNQAAKRSRTSPDDIIVLSNDFYEVADVAGPKGTRTPNQYDAHKRPRFSHVPVPDQASTRAGLRAEVSGPPTDLDGCRPSAPGSFGSDDPFATTPPWPTGIQFITRVTASNAPRSISPQRGYTSTTPRAQALAPPVAARREHHVHDPISSDPFRLSSPIRDRSRAPMLEQDLISSSAPQTVEQRQPLAVRNPSAVVALDSSEDEMGSHALLDSSDELPEPSKLARLVAHSRAAKSGALPAPRLKCHDPENKSEGSRLGTLSQTTPVEDGALPKRRQPGERAREKEAERERKRLEREAKSHERQKAAALAEANKIKSTDKKASSREMIVILPAHLSPALTLQVEALLAGIAVEVQTDQNALDTIKWKRKVTSEFNQDMRGWEPVPLRVEAEKFLLVVLTVEEFMAKLTARGGRDIVWDATQLEKHNPGHQIIYLLEGIASWMRKARNVRNRQFTSAVRKADEAIGRRKTDDVVSEDVVEDTLLKLQLIHDSVLVHHTETSAETACWIMVFTQHISTIRYKRHLDIGISFCMDAGQVRSGEDKDDTYIRLLQEISRITAPVATGISAEYGTVNKLVAGLRDNGPLALEDIVRRNRDRTESHKAIGQAVSRRVYSIFTSLNEETTQV